jgi:Lipocalin-like domain
MENNNEITNEQLLGTWYLVSLTFKGKDGIEHDYMGKNPQGILQYTKEGIVSVQHFPTDRKKLTTEDWASAGLEEIKEAFLSYQAYHGRYELDLPNKTAYHHVKGSIVPNWHIDKHIEERYFEIKGDNLIITMPPILVMGDEKYFTATWTRKMPDYLK